MATRDTTEVAATGIPSSALLDALAKAAAADVRFATVHGRPVFVAPRDVDVRFLDELEDLAERPYRIEAQRTADTAKGFVDYFNRFALSSSVILAHEGSSRFIGIIDYHTADHMAAWCKHTITYPLPLTVDYSDWKKSNNQWMDQAAFAEFIEDHVDSIIDPPGGEILSLVTKFKATKEVKFESAKNLSNGDTQLIFVEQTSAKGEIVIPEKFTIALSPYKDERNTLYKIAARFKYKIGEGSLALRYQLQRIDKMQEQAFNDAIAEISEKVQPTGALIIRGH